MAKLHLHHLENSRSFRILWLLEELGLEYQLTKYERTKAYLAPDTLKQIHPSGKAPILEVYGLESAETSTPLIESAHIIDLLMLQYDTDNKFHPKTCADSQAWRDYNLWMHFSEASMMPWLVMRLVFSKIVERSPMFVKPFAKGIRKQVELSVISNNISEMLNMVETHLSKNRWFAGSQFSAADIQMAFVMEAAAAREGLDEIKFSNTFTWLKRCQLRPAYLKAVQIGGELAF